MIAYLIDPDLFEGRTINVSIETVSQLTRGMTVADFWGVTPHTEFPRNAHFLSKANAEGFYDLLCERLARLP